MWPAISRAALVAKFVAVGFTEDEAKRITDRLCPAPVTLEQLMKMAWRVREWKVEAASFSYTGFRQIIAPGPYHWTITAALPEISLKMKRVKVPADIDDPLRDVTDEQDILGPATDADLGLGLADPWATLRNAGVQGTADPEEIEVSGSTDDNGPSPHLIDPAHDPPDQTFGSFVASLLGSYVIYDSDSGMFFPPIFIGGFFSVVNPNVGVGQTAGAQCSFYTLPVTPTAPPDPTPPAGVAGDVQQGTLTIQGIGTDIVVPVGMFGEQDGSAPPGWPDGGSGSVTLEMSPVSYWPYKNSLGAPVYAEATGAQLVDPFS